MKILLKSIACLFLAICAANATVIDSFAQEKGNVEDPSAVDYTKISVYLHPVMLLVGANAKTLFLYSTIEIPISLYNSPIIKPSVWNQEYFSRVGVDLGFRHYPSGRGEGLYLQPQVGAFYLSAKDGWSFSLDEEESKVEKISGKWLDVMGYLGYAYKFKYLSIYSDSGIGYACIQSECGLMFDANIGIGISF